MATAGTVTIDFAAEVAKFNADLKKVQDQVRSLDDRFGSFSDVVEGAGKKLVGLVSAGAIVAFAKEAIAAADAIGDMAERVGESVESISRMKFIAEQSDLSFASLEGAVKILNRTLSDAANGSDEAAQKFFQIGLSAEELIQLPLEQRMAEIAGAFDRIPNAADRGRIAMELFGRSGDELVPLLDRGKEGIEALAEQAESSGNVLSTTAADGIDFFIKKMQSMVGSFKTGVAEIFGASIAITAGLEKETATLVRKERELAEVEGLIAEGRLVAQGTTATRIEDLRTEINLLREKVLAVQAAAQAEAQIVFQNFEPQLEAPKLFVTDEELRAAEQLAARKKALRDQERAEAAATRAEDSAIKEAAMAQELLDKFQQDLLIETANQEHLDRMTEQFRAQNEELVDIKSTTEQALLDITRQFGVELINYEALKNQTIGDMALGLFADVVGHNKKFAKIAQKIAIAQATWNTLVGVTEALKLPFPKNIVVAAIVAAYGAAQIAKIKSTSIESPSGSISGGGTGGGAGASTADATQQDIARQAPQRVTEVTVRGQITDQTGRVIADLISNEVQNRDVVIFTASSRQAQELGAVGA